MSQEDKTDISKCIKNINHATNTLGNYLYILDILMESKAQTKQISDDIDIVLSSIQINIDQINNSARQLKKIKNNGTTNA